MRRAKRRAQFTGTPENMTTTRDTVDGANVVTRASCISREAKPARMTPLRHRNRFANGSSSIFRLKTFIHMHHLRNIWQRPALYLSRVLTPRQDTQADPRSNVYRMPLPAAQLQPPRLVLLFLLSRACANASIRWSLVALRPRDPHNTDDCSRTVSVSLVWFSPTSNEHLRYLTIS